jgi:hypothetical protein
VTEKCPEQARSFSRSGIAAGAGHADGSIDFIRRVARQGDRFDDRLGHNRATSTAMYRTCGALPIGARGTLPGSAARACHIEDGPANCRRSKHFRFRLKIGIQQRIHQVFEFRLEFEFSIMHKRSHQSELMVIL